MIVSGLVASLSVFLFDQWAVTQPFSSFSWITLLFFLLFTIGVFFLAQWASNSKNPTSFVQVVISALGIKLFGAVILILVFDRLFEPETRWFLLPFFTLYLIYSILETYLLMKMGKAKTTPSPA